MAENGIPPLAAGINMPTMSAAPPQPPAGWYPDPDGAPTQRYFDGKKWTDQLAPLAAPARSDDGYSTKSSAVAGLLQIFLGWFGLGRFYIGDTTIGIVQLALGIFGWITTFIFIGWVILFILSVWVIIEGICMLAGAIPDHQGRKLR